MKKIITAILSMLVVLSLFGCSQQPQSTESGNAEPSVNPDLGVTLEAVDVTSTGMTLRCTQSGGKAEGELQTGSEFRLEVMENGEWKAVKPLVAEVVWTAEAWLIPMNETVEWTVDWEWPYGELPAGGNYRIVKSIMDFKGPGDYNLYDCYAEFAVVD